jgi:hypothetical protein
MLGVNGAESLYLHANKTAISNIPMVKLLKATGVVLLAGLLFTACKKEGDNKKLGDENEPVSDFMSTKAGSWWQYGSTRSSSLVRRATGVDSFKESRMYSYYETTDEESQYVTPEYFGKNEDKYIMLADLDGSATNYITVVVNKDNAQVGDQWENTGEITYSGIKFDLRTKGEVVGAGGSMSINGVTYTDVTEIKNNLEAKIALTPVYTKCGTATMWFARGIGIIKTDFDIRIANGLFEEKYVDSLIQYHIEPE